MGSVRRPARRILTVGLLPARRRTTARDKAGRRPRRLRRWRRRLLLAPLLYAVMMIGLPMLIISAIRVPPEVEKAVEVGEAVSDAASSVWGSLTGGGGHGSFAGVDVGGTGDIPHANVFNSTAALGIDPRLVVAVASAESDFRPDVMDCSAPSDAGALGIMQFMPATATERGVDPCDPASAIPGGARYLLELYQQFGRWDLATAAYNAGPDKVTQYGGIPPYAETQNYVAEVMATWEDHVRLFPASAVGAAPAGASPQRAEVLRRAQTWIDAGGVPYSMSAYHEGWRTDCSGYVSMAWGLSQPGATTVTLASTHAVPIDRSQLQPGDILLDADPGSAGHVMLFDHWDPDPNYVWIYEQAARSGTAHRRIAYPTTEYLPYRNPTLP